MIGGKDIYSVVIAMLPLYWAMFLGYASVRWWKVLTADQCLGINRFVSMFAVPFLIFHFIIANNPYHMDPMFVLADILSKVVVIIVLAVWAYINAKAKTAGNVSSSSSLDWAVTIFSLATLPNLLIIGVPLLDAMYGEVYSGIVVQLAVVQCIIWCPFILLLYEYRATCPRLSNTGSIAVARAEAESSVTGENTSDIDVVSIDSTSNSDAHITSSELDREGHILSRSQNIASESMRSMGYGANLATLSISKEFNSSSVTSPKSEASGTKFSTFRTRGDHLSDVSKQVQMNSYTNQQQDYAIFLNEEMLTEDREYSINVSGSNHPGSPAEKSKKDMPKILTTDVELKRHPSETVTLRPILQMVAWKLFKNPITYSSLLGLVWALIAFRWNIALPKVVNDSITILSNAGLGMAMFSLGLYMALQPRLISCGKKIAALAMLMRFIISPIVIAAMASIIGLRGVDLYTAIIQAALPQGIVTFIFAREYDLHPDILSTGVFFGTVISLPITLLYYILLDLA